MHIYVAQCSEAVANNANYSEKQKQAESGSKKKFVSTAGATIETTKNVSAQNFLTLLLNQIKGVFKGEIEIHSEFCLTPNLKDEIQELHRANFFMSLESTYDEFIDISYSAHKSSFYELMRLVSTNL